MSDYAVKVESLSKRYRIGIKENAHETLGGAIAGFIRNPLARFQQLRKLRKFSVDEGDKDIIWALKNVSFEVEHGDVVGIIGRNGAGKSTLLKIMSRITEPTSGSIILNGRISSLLEVGTGFHPDLTGRENIFLNGTILGMTKSEISSKFDEIVAFSEIEKFIDTPVKRYSSGMRVRLAFAVAAHLEPEILLVDEVLAVGDVAFQRRCLGKMKDVAEGGRTVLFVSHNMGAVRTLCSSAILLEHGEIIRTGNPDKIIDAYLYSSLENCNTMPGQWINPDRERSTDTELTIKSVRVINKANKPTDMLPVNEEIRVVIHYQLHKKILSLRLCLQIQTEEGLIAFTSYENKAVLESEEVLPGNYEADCIIPGNLLNAKSYIVLIGMDQPKIKSLIPLKPMVRFSVVETTHLYIYPRGYSGVIRPNLDWKIRPL